MSVNNGRICRSVPFSNMQITGRVSWWQLEMEKLVDFWNLQDGGSYGWKFPLFTRRPGWCKMSNHKDKDPGIVFERHLPVSCLHGFDMFRLTNATPHSPLAPWRCCRHDVLWHHYFVALSRVVPRSAPWWIDHRSNMMIWSWTMVFWRSTGFWASPISANGPFTSSQVIQLKKRLVGPSQAHVTKQLVPQTQVCCLPESTAENGGEAESLI